MKTDLPDFLQPLLRITDGYPTEAIEAAIQRREESVPHLLQALEDALADPDEILEDPRYMLHIYAIFILGYLKEPQALGPMLALGRESEVDDLLGDTVTESLGQAFANLCADRPEALYSLIEDVEIDEYVRSAALQALGTLHHTGTLSRETLASYLTLLYETKLEKGHSHAWDSAISLSADFRMAEHLPLIRDAYENGYADPFFDQFEDVEAAIAGKINDAHRLRDYQNLGHPHEELKHWHCFDSNWNPDPIDDDLDDEDFHDKPMSDCSNAPKPKTPIGSDRLVASGTTFQRDTPKVGRNDPCPCGSGKKYKKCCGS